MLYELRPEMSQMLAMQWRGDNLLRLGDFVHENGAKLRPVRGNKVRFTDHRTNAVYMIGIWFCYRPTDHQWFFVDDETFQRHYESWYDRNISKVVLN